MKEFPRPPLLTLLLVAGNIFAAFALVVNPDLAFQFGFRADAPEFRNLFTALFLHENILHLLGNMLFLAAFGAAVEAATGTLRFALVYFVSGFVGEALHYLLLRNVSHAVPLIGASGCIAGLVGYYALRYQAVRVPVVPRLALPVLTLTGLWVLLQVIGAFVRLGDSGGTAYWAHLGGFGTGVLLSLVFHTPDFGQTEFGRQTVDQMQIRGPAAVKIAAQQHIKNFPKDPEGWRKLADACRELADADTESRAITQILDLSPDQNDPTLLQRLVALGKLDTLSVYERLKLADRYRESHRDLATSLAKSGLQDATEAQRPDALLTLIGLERGRNEANAQLLLQELFARYPLSTATDLAHKKGWAN